MILIWGAVYDNPLKEVFAELQSRDIPVLLIDQKYIQRSKIELDISSPVSCTINYLNQVFHSEDVRSVYIRTYDFTQEDEWTSDKLYDEAHRHAYRFEEYMSIWLEHSTLKVVNKLSNSISNSSKPFQMDIIRKHGFKVPETIITTDPEFAKEFLAKHKKIIYKSISSFRSIVSCLTKNDISRLNDVIFCPTQFQKNIDGTDYRVHVLGEKIFPVRQFLPILLPF